MLKILVFFFGITVICCNKGSFNLQCSSHCCHDQVAGTLVYQSLLRIKQYFLGECFGQRLQLKQGGLVMEGCDHKAGESGLRAHSYSLLPSVWIESCFSCKSYRICVRHWGIPKTVLSTGVHPDMSRSIVTLPPTYDIHPSREHHCFLPCHCLNLHKIGVIF